MANWTLKELELWDARIRDKAEAFGLQLFPQEFEIYDHNEMLGAMAYSGMPSHYPHWSYGKGFEKLKTMYDYGVSGLPYEMVINSNPSLAYLMRDNTLLLQILTIAHVYGHNDFFRNNFTFKSTRPDYVLGSFKAHALRVRSYMEDPSIGVDRVERILDAAHALSLQCRRNLAVKKLSASAERERLLDAAKPRQDPYASLHARASYSEPDLHKNPPSPEEDLLLFIRDANPFLAGWERDLLTIVHEETQYFIPQIETKIINEGWASFWHREILNSLELPQDLQLEFLVRHNQVVRPVPGGLNPYHLGLKLWDDIRRRFCGGAPEQEGGGPEGGETFDKLFEVRASERDASFLRRFLTEDLLRELDLFEYRSRGDEKVISEVADDEGWEQVKATLIKGVGMGSVPVIKVEEAGYGRHGALYLKHDHDDRDLHLDYAERTLAYVHRLWGKEVLLETVIEGRRLTLSFGDRGFSVKR
jgi:stage V sporulation protein R